MEKKLWDNKIITICFTRILNSYHCRRQTTPTQESSIAERRTEYYADVMSFWYRLNKGRQNIIGSYRKLVDHIRNGDRMPRATPKLTISLYHNTPRGWDHVYWREASRYIGMCLKGYSIVIWWHGEFRCRPGSMWQSFATDHRYYSKQFLKLMSMLASYFKLSLRIWSFGFLEVDNMFGPKSERMQCDPFTSRGSGCITALCLWKRLLWTGYDIAFKDGEPSQGVMIDDWNMVGESIA